MSQTFYPKWTKPNVYKIGYFFRLVSYYFVETWLTSLFFVFCRCQHDICVERMEYSINFVLQEASYIWNIQSANTNPIFVVFCSSVETMTDSIFQIWQWISICQLIIIDFCLIARLNVFSFLSFSNFVFFLQLLCQRLMNSMYRLLKLKTNFVIIVLISNIWLLNGESKWNTFVEIDTH